MPTDYLDKIFEKMPNLSESTKRMYKYNLEYLNNKKPITNLKFLEDHETILKKLEKFTPNNKKNYLAAASSIINKSNTKNKKLKEAQNIYKKIIFEVSIENRKNSNTISTHIRENWVSLQDVKKKSLQLNKYINTLKNKENLNDVEYRKLLELVVLSLYTLIPPRRELDYTDMIVSDNDDSESNVFNIRDKHFVFRKYKTAKVSGVQIIDIPKRLFSILMIYIKFLKSKFPKDDNTTHFLIWEDGRPFKRLDIYKVLSSIFGKKTGSTNMRRLYISSKYGDMKNDLKKDAENMGTSVDVIESNYIKNNV